MGDEVGGKANKRQQTAVRKRGTNKKEPKDQNIKEEEV